MTGKVRKADYILMYDAIHVHGYSNFRFWAQVLTNKLTSCSSGILKKNVAALSSEIIRKQKEVFTEESIKYTFVLRTKDVKFDCELLGELE